MQQQKCFGPLTAIEAELLACFRLMSEPAREVVISMCAASIVPPKHYTRAARTHLKLVKRQT